MVYIPFYQCFHSVQISRISSQTYLNIDGDVGRSKKTDTMFYPISIDVNVLCRAVRPPSRSFSQIYLSCYICIQPTFYDSGDTV